ncbi:hypothetical protein FVEG_17601 [Fusarium verticillioides 7600]|uniref:Uncharacterized protein n=1 Tax=Gibberella moniliformis (strain M3125 / FGSC 7600) TaxID=334819 RepID=W7MWZ6_GIBM7|nr:hypothetical protein FVEG_17601 [Fusarium verticillioides 7600]EWG55823.1 hypothetical protein FVEG_17601 [Fusarium verticillioides 7600]
MTTVSELINCLWKAPPYPAIRLHKDRTHPANFVYYKSWGFNIYRTYYGKGSDKHWAMLLDALKRQTYLALRDLEEDREYELDNRRRIHHHQNKQQYMEDLEIFRKLFHLEAREGPELEGLDIYQVREISAEENKEGKVITVGGRVQYVLVADEAVLRNIAEGEFVVKAVAYKWDRSMNWGWMRIPTGYLFEFWQSLVLCDRMDRDIIWFLGPEEELERCIWPGEDSLEATSCCSEVRPLYYHYSGQALWVEIETEIQKLRIARTAEMRGIQRELSSKFCLPD